MQDKQAEVTTQAIDVKKQPASLADFVNLEDEERGEIYVKVMTDATNTDQSN